jgi:hypothetical protein
MLHARRQGGADVMRLPWRSPHRAGGPGGDPVAAGVAGSLSSIGAGGAGGGLVLMPRMLGNFCGNRGAPSSPVLGRNRSAGNTIYSDWVGPVDAGMPIAAWAVSISDSDADRAEQFPCNIWGWPASWPHSQRVACPFPGGLPQTTRSGYAPSTPGDLHAIEDGAHRTWGRAVRGACRWYVGSAGQRLNVSHDLAASSAVLSVARRRPVCPTSRAPPLTLDIRCGGGGGSSGDVTRWSPMDSRPSRVRMKSSGVPVDQACGLQAVGYSRGWLLQPSQTMLRVPGGDPPVHSGQRNTGQLTDLLTHPALGRPQHDPRPGGHHTRHIPAGCHRPKLGHLPFGQLHPNMLRRRQPPARSDTSRSDNVNRIT